MGRFEKALFLSIGQIAGLCFGMLTPMLLSRWMEVEAFGTYRQLLMGLWLSGFILHLGMDLGLFYFIKKTPAFANVFSFNASALTFTVATILGIICVLFSSQIASLFNNPDLQELIPWLAILIIFAVPSQHLEQLFIIKDKSVQFIAFVSTFSLLQAAITISTIYYWQDLKIMLIGLIFLFAIKFMALTFINIKSIIKILGFQLTRTIWITSFKEQLRYSLPLGVTGSLHAVMQFDRLLISSLYNVSTFAKYSVGCFNLPVIPGLLDNIHNLMSIEMVDLIKKKNVKGAFNVWIQSTSRIALVAIPTFTFFSFYAEDVMVGLFSEKYRDSAKYFQVFLVSFLVFAFDPELILRSFDRTKTSMNLQILATLMTGFFIALGIWKWGPIGALIGKAFADVLDLFFKFTIVSKILKVQLNQILPYTKIFLCIFAAGLALVLTAWIPNMQIHLQLVACFSSAGIVYLSLCRILPILSKEDINVIAFKVRRFRNFISRI